MIELAKAATAAQVERTVAGWRRAETITPDERARRRQVSWSFDEDGMLRLHARLDAEEGAVLVAALEAARAQLTRDSAATTGTPISAASLDPTRTTGLPSSVDALSAVAHAYLAVGWLSVRDPSDGDPSQGDLSQGDSAEPRGACGPRGAGALRRAERRIPTELIVRIDAEALEDRARGGIATYQTGGALTYRQVRQFACDTKLITILTRGAEVLDVGRATRTVPRRIRRALLARDGGCSMPGCTEHRADRLHAHHVIHWADGGPTALDNLILLCAGHHWAVHHDQLHVAAAAGRFTYRAADGSILTPVPPMPDLVGSAIELPTVDSAGLDSAGLDSAGHAASTRQSHGDAFDLDYILSVLLGRRRNRRRQQGDGPATRLAA